MDPLHQGLQHRAVDIFMACKKGLLQEVVDLLDSGAILRFLVGFPTGFWMVLVASSPIEVPHLGGEIYPYEPCWLGPICS